MEQDLLDVDSDISAQIDRVDDLAELSRKSGKELENALAMRMSQHFIQVAIVERIKLNLQTLNMKREGLLQKYTERHPEVAAVDEQITAMHNALELEIQNAYQIEKQELKALNASGRSPSGSPRTTGTLAQWRRSRG